MNIDILYRQCLQCGCCCLGEVKMQMCKQPLMLQRHSQKKRKCETWFLRYSNICQPFNNNWVRNFISLYSLHYDRLSEEPPSNVECDVTFNEPTSYLIFPNQGYIWTGSLLIDGPCFSNFSFCLQFDKGHWFDWIQWKSQKK